MTDIERHAALLADLDREVKTTVYLSRQEARHYEDQAGGDYRFADRMIEDMERFRTMARNDAAALIRGMAFDGDFRAFVEAGVAGLAAPGSRGDCRHGAGVAPIVALLQRHLES